MPSRKPLYGVRREQQRPHLRSHRRGLGRLLGADVAPQAGRAQRSPSDGTLQHRHPAAVRTGGAWSAGTPRTCGSAPPRRRSPTPTRTAARIEWIPWTSGPSPCLRRITEARVHDPVRAPERAASTAQRPSQERQAQQGSAHASVPVPARRARPGGIDAERARRAQRSQVLARRRRTTVGPLPRLHARRDRRGGRRPRASCGRPRAGRAAERVHRASARPGAAPLRLHHGPAPGRGGGAAAAREPPPQAPARRDGRAAEPDEEPEARHPEPEPAPTVSPQEAGRRALVEQTDHAEWVDQQRERGRARRATAGSPVPVPLPTYVTAPVAPRATGGVEVGDPETWSAARSSTAEPAQPGTTDPRPHPAVDPAPRQRTNQSRRTRDRGRTPLFDQYEDGDRPRAANE